MHYAYVLRSKVNDSLYFGSTKDIKKRLASHNNGQVAHTKKGKPWGVLWYGAFESDNEAILFERYLKTAFGKAFARKRLFPQN